MLEYTVLLTDISFAQYRICWKAQAQLRNDQRPARGRRYMRRRAKI